MAKSVLYTRYNVKNVLFTPGSALSTRAYGRSLLGLGRLHRPGQQGRAGGARDALADGLGAARASRSGHGERDGAHSSIVVRSYREQLDFGC